MGTKISANALTLGRPVCSTRPLGPPLHEFLAQPAYRIRPPRPSSFGPAKQLETNRSTWFGRTAQPGRVESFSPINTEPFAWSNGIA